LRAQVIETTPAEEALRVIPPQVILTELAEPIRPVQPLATALPERPVRRGRAAVPLGLTALALFLVGWAVVDAAVWVSSAFEHGPVLGTLAGLAIAAGVAGAGVIVGRELTSLFRLKNVEAIQQRFRDHSRLDPSEAKKTVADILAVVPRDPALQRAIEAFQRQAQAHHGPAQQIDLLARTVIEPLDRRAEAHVRNAVVRSFGIVAISPTALTDAAFFLACGVRMVRAIASSYGHRPTAAATFHLLRRLVLEAGKLGAVDIASTTLMQHLGGAVAERVATSAADALYAAYRMARLGIIVMELCRPIPFREDSLPSLSSLVGNVVRRQTEKVS
jgi:putative membrane protein